MQNIEAIKGCRLTYLNQYNRNGVVINKILAVEVSKFPRKIDKDKTARKDSCNPGSAME
jgi:hypothetical protein